MVSPRSGSPFRAARKGVPAAKLVWFGLVAGGLWIQWQGLNALMMPGSTGLSWGEWKKGKDFEEQFWRKWVGDQGGKWGDDFKFRLGINSTTPFQFCDMLRKLPHGDDGYRVLNVGAGPLNELGSMCGDVRVDVIPCDPLAPIYDKILGDFSIQPYKRTQYALVEELVTSFAQNHFHLVDMQNALDHSADPMHGILQMLAVTKPGGIVHLRHYRNEAEKGYKGFHQWNIDIDKASQNFIIWNKSQQLDVTKNLKGIATVNASFVKRGNWVDCVITKTPTSPQD